MTDQHEQEFAAPVLHGRRFEQHALPLDVLRELEAYQRLILDVAKALFLEAHPGRQRVPRGFEDRLALTLRKVEPGSAMPVLLRSEPVVAQQQVPLIPPSPDEFEQARDIISAVVEAASAGKALPTRFPKDMLARFNTFGRSLRSDEAIELRARRDAQGPRYDRALRKRLVLMAQTSFTDTVDVVGTVCEADVDKNMFHLLVEDQKITGVFANEQEEQVLSALKDHETVQLRVVGSGSFDSQERLVRIDELDEITILEREAMDSVGLAKRVEELKALEAGWLDGEAGTPLDVSGLDELGKTLVELNDQEELPLPFLYPTPDGGVQAEWTLGTWEVSAEVDLTTGTVELDAVHRGSGAAKEVTTSVRTAEGRLELVKFIASFLPQRGT